MNCGLYSLMIKLSSDVSGILVENVTVNNNNNNNNNQEYKVLGAEAPLRNALCCCYMIVFERLLHPGVVELVFEFID